MPLISPAGFPIAYRLGYRGGKVEARVKLNDDIWAIAIALNPQPNNWLTGFNVATSVCIKTVRNLTTQSLGLRPTSLKTIPAFVSVCWQGRNSQQHLDAVYRASLRPSSAPTVVHDPAMPNFEPVPFPALPALHGVSVSPTLSHYSADGHIITTSSTLVADPASDIFGSSAQLPSPVAENISAREASVISEAITFDLVHAVRLIVWTHDAIPTHMTVYPRKVGQAYSELLLRDYQQTLLAIGFNVNIPGEMLVEIQQHQMWTPWGSDLPLPITRNNQLVFIRSWGAPADPDVVLDDLFPPN
ncbi:hypothetical protein B0H10DRAFT_2436174 [Mycena sp. CBHHK59/15]|nr:hypothetical protein B0H10DRAFT_2436174 [Mycena sp. CBHHK59/15]